MANFCEDCDYLNKEPSGNAPQRTPFSQPTMYDHIPAFRKYKQTKECEKTMKARKEDLSKFNDNFTNMQLSSMNSVDGIFKDAFDDFSTEEIVKYRQDLKEILKQKNKDTPRKQENEDNGSCLKKTPSLLTISRTPVQCPVTKCGRTVGVTSVLSHYLRDHNEELVVQCQEIYSGRSLLIFDPTQFEFRENICLGVLAYGGRIEYEYDKVFKLLVEQNFMEYSV